MSTPRLLMLMGSGETAPTMVKPHRALLDRLGRDPVPAVMLETPYGFQENASDISAKAVEYFRSSVGRDIEMAGLARLDGSDTVARETGLGRLARARWVFAGPGSPTYALRQWRGSEVPDLLADKMAHGGCVVFASAAALTLGAWTVPVYEVYKVGAEAEWLVGLDLLSPLGLPAAVIPHYNNTEGRGHDTRFCYLGERRLRILEEQLPDEAWVLGVDEHTGCLIDLDARHATVVGHGVVTIRRHGRSTTVASGERVSLDAMVAMAADRGGAGGGTAGGAAAGGGAAGPDLGAAGAARGAAGDGAAGGGAAGPGASGAGGIETAQGQATPPLAEGTPLMADVRRLEAAFDAAIDALDVDAAVRAVLDLDAALFAWGADTNQSDEQDRGRAALRRMIARLGQLAVSGARDPREVIGPFVDALLAERATARSDRRFADADRIRDGLVDLGVEVRDAPGATEWVLNG